MNYEKRREKTAKALDNNGLMILYSGIPMNVSADEYYMFEANRFFFYLTGLRRENMILTIYKTGEKYETDLFIEEANPDFERWTGKMVTGEEAKELSKIERVHYLQDFEGFINRLFTRRNVSKLYFDCHREGINDIESYNLMKASEFKTKYPAVSLLDISPVISSLRREKDIEEVALLKEAINITGEGLKYVLKNLKPGMKEYQAQADFEYRIKYLGAERVAFPTIAGSGKNGTMLHYETNLDECKDGTLLLLDLGAKKDGYCADITRTYPVNGHFTDRQREVYNIVLKANREVMKNAKPGVTVAELNEICKHVLAKGCISLGLIENESEIGKYYMHGVSHSLGIDVHDVGDRGEKLVKGCVITDEPGLYIDEWEIGIRIEDDLLITENGCECLSEDIMREPDEIEKFMRENKR